MKTQISQFQSIETIRRVNRLRAYLASYETAKARSESAKYRDVQKICNLLSEKISVQIQELEKIEDLNPLFSAMVKEVRGQLFLN